MNTENATASARAPQASILGLRTMARQACTYPRRIHNAIRAGQIPGARREGHRWVAPAVSLNAWASANPTLKYRKTEPVPSDAPARDPIYDDPGYRVMNAIIQGYSECLDLDWMVTFNGMTVMHSRGREGWSSNNKRDAYLTVCAVARLMGLGEFICEEFIHIVDEIVDHNYVSNMNRPERSPVNNSPWALPNMSSLI